MLLCVKKPLTGKPKLKSMVIPWETLKREPVSTIPRKGSRAEFVTARNGVPVKTGKI